MNVCTCHRAGLAQNEHWLGCPWVLDFKRANVVRDGPAETPLPPAPAPRRPYERPKGLAAPTLKKAPATSKGPGRTA